MDAIKKLFLDKVQCEDLIYGYGFNMDDAVFKIVPFEDGDYIIQEAFDVQENENAIPTYSLQEMLAKLPMEIKEGKLIILPVENKIGYAVMENGKMTGWAKDLSYEFNLNGVYELITVLCRMWRL